MSNCTKCHVLGNKVTNNKCLDCHTEIDQKIKSGTGYHSASRVKGKECIICHNEHHGRNFKLTKFDINNFNHQETGFQLAGKHAGIKCEECHNQKNIHVPQVKNRKNTYLGLQKNCISCHEDFHQALLGAECQSCHNTVSFKPASLFNHSKIEFKLTGAHIKLNCSKCHPAENRDGKVHIKFKGIKFRNCTSCHKDIHLGKFGIDCKKCHSTNGFKKIITAEFNHSLTGFPLTGKHIKIECSTCHKEGMKVKFKYDRCSDCHEDFHKGEFTSVNNSTDCIKCHNTDGFKPSLFSTEAHTYTNFVLAGKHLAVSCRECHHTGNELKFKFADLSCVTCHANIHQDEITEKYLGNNNCKNCHNENSWHDISFDHKATGFILEGKHAAVSCNSCHTGKIDATIKYIFKSVQSECESCHTDIHAGQFKFAGHTDCSKCHQADGWKKSTFDHSKTSFPLTGAHKSVECGKCHKSVVASNNDHYMVYKIGKSKCSDCHQ